MLNYTKNNEFTISTEKYQMEESRGFRFHSHSFDIYSI
jgi:hypothetical protein